MASHARAIFEKRAALVLLCASLSAGCGDVLVFDTRDASLDASLDGGTRVDAACEGAPPPPQCSAMGPAGICFENVSACAGEEVDVPVIVQGEGCPATFDQGAGIQAGPFELANPQLLDPSVGRCLRRETVGDSFEWAQLSEATIAEGCPATFARGTVDRLRLRIPEDVPPGDYRLEGLWGLIQSEGECGTMAPALGPLIRVR
ncbi:MAG: hypothetical protein AAGE52_30295 [Myxococcota bacterium]